MYINILTDFDPCSTVAGGLIIIIIIIMANYMYMYMYKYSTHLYI